MPPITQSNAVLIPDCCNVGVVFRVLASVNMVVLCAILLQVPNFTAGWHTFLRAATVVELATLWSLFGLCLLRRLLARGAYPARLPWGQRIGSAIVPALVTTLVVWAIEATGMVGGAGLAAWKAAVVAGLFGAAFQHYFELRTRAFSPALVEARLQALQARIRPHFLFNSLNAVLSLIRSEPKRAENALEDLAELIRIQMSDARNLSTLEEELRLCKQYLAIEEIRIGDRLRVHWRVINVGEQLMQRARVPVLLLQPLLENAVRYGVEPFVAPAPIEVRIERLLDRIEIAVSNAWDAERVQVSPGNHMALDNIRERLTLLYDVEAQLVVDARHDRFEVRMRFPYLTAAA